MVSTAYVPRGEELCVRVNACPRPHVPGSVILSSFSVLALRVAERPCFVTLDTLDGETSDGLVVVEGAEETRIHLELHNGVYRDSGDP